MTGSSHTYFLWEVEGKTVSILVNLDAIDQLESATARDPNIHGILYGRIDQIPGKRCILVIERLEHYKDLQRVGYYRTIHKSDLSIGESDLAPLRRYLTDPASVLLLIRPSKQDASTAGFFVWENGLMQQSSVYREFPLNRKILEEQKIPMVQIARKDGFAFEPVVRESPPATTAPKRPLLVLNPWIWAPVTIALLLLTVTLSRRNSAIPEPVKAPAVAQFGQGPSLDLNAQRMGQALRLTWNKSNPTVLDAERGVLWIKDGSSEQRLDLDTRQLTTGSVMYWPTSNDVNFRLEVFGVSKFSSESLRAYEGPPPGSVSPAPATAKAPAPQATPPQQSNRQNIDTQNVQTRARTKDSADPLQAPTTTPAPSRVEDPATTKDPPVAPPVETAAAAPSALSPAPQTPPVRPVKKDNSNGISVAIEPVQESGLRKAVQVVPGLRSLQKYKGGTHFTPARAIEKVTPTLTPALKQSITGEVQVDLRVSIDEEGNIFRTEVLPGNADSRLLNLAADAAKRWRFEPARIDTKPVSSKVVLHFTFKNPA